MSTSLYPTAAIMRQAEVHSVTSENGANLIENMLDHSLDSYWQPTTTGDQAIIIDLQSAKTVDSVVLWVHNYETDHGPTSSPFIEVDHSDDGSSWGTTWVVITWASIIANYMDAGLVVLASAGSVTKRYFRIRLLNMATTIELSFFAVAQKYQLGRDPDYPHRPQKTYNNTVRRLPSGRLSVARGTGLPFEDWSAVFSAFLAADLTMLEAIFDQSLGCGAPIAYQTDANSHKLVWLVNDFVPEELAYQVWRVTMEFSDVRYTADGATY